MISVLYVNMLVTTIQYVLPLCEEWVRRRAKITSSPPISESNPPLLSIYAAAFVGLASDNESRTNTLET